MGWKSTITLSRQEALDIIAGLNGEEMTNEQLGDLIEAMNGGEEHGHNYMVLDHYDREKEDERFR